jgi:hypothetical protein
MPRKKRKHQKKQTTGYVLQPQWRPLQVTEDEAELLAYLLGCYQPGHRLIAHCDKVVEYFNDDALRVREIVAQVSATAYWEEPQNLQDKRLRSIAEKRRARQDEARAKLEAKEIRRELRKAAKAKAAELRAAQIEEYRNGRAAKIEAEKNGHGVGVVVKPTTPSGSGRNRSKAEQARVAQEDVVQQPVEGGAGHLEQPSSTAPPAVGTAGADLGGNEVQHLPVEERDGDGEGVG